MRKVTLSGFRSLVLKATAESNYGQMKEFDPKPATGKFTRETE